MKKWIALLLTAALLTGCSAPGAPETTNTEPEPVTEEAVKEDPMQAPDQDLTESPVVEASGREEVFQGRDDISYVLIYNPGLYDENKNLYNEDLNETLSTGELSDQIDVSLSRAGELEPMEYEFIPVAQKSPSEALGSMEIDLTGSKADGLQPVYQAGDTHQFYVSFSDYAASALKEFTCQYVGEHCCVWIYGDTVSPEESEAYGKVFDSEIYERDVELFGTPRYAESGGKIHILFHPYEEGVLGFFHPLDLFATGEVSPAEVEQYGVNLDHAMLHINSLYVGLPGCEDMINCTMAHEFQHLINFTDYFFCLIREFSSTWLNEGMSGYAEESLFPGVKAELEGHYEAFVRSSLIRHGQSMYSFKTDRYDIGVYGSVALFTQYLANETDGEVYKRFHDYWRNSYSTTLCDAEALYNSVPEAFIGEISDSFDYPSMVNFDTKEEEWMSKLVLNFYLSLLKYDEGDPEAYQLVQAQTLLYDEVNPADIQGGGRVIVATMDGTFSIPENSDDGLLYLGLDENFRPITDLAFK